MKINLDSPAEEVRIEVLPLIDVIFCILTFFILGGVGLSRQQAINLDLPRANVGTTLNDSKGKAEVRMDPSGQLYFDELAVTPEELFERARRYRVQYPDQPIVLNASRRVEYDYVISVLKLLKDAAGQHVSLGVSPGSSNQLLEGSPQNPPAFGQPDSLPLPNDRFNNPLNDPLNPGSGFNDPFGSFTTPSPGNPGPFNPLPGNPGTTPQPGIQTLPPLNPNPLTGSPNPNPGATLPPRSNN